MKIIKCNLLDLAEQGEFDIIVHGCNCLNSMGGGIAKQIKERYPQAYEADQLTNKGSKFKLGKYSSAKIDDKFTIINAYTQFNLKSIKDVFEYEAFQRVLDTLDTEFPGDTRFGFPFIGCGLAGGDRTRIISMLEKFSENRNVTLVEFE